MLQLINSFYPIDLVLEFCKASIGDSRPNATNMDTIDWEKKSHTLLYCLYVEERFDDPRNGYIVNIEDGKIVSGLGFYTSDWDDNIYIERRGYTVPGSLKGLSLKDAINTNSMRFAIEDCSIGRGFLGGITTFERYNEHILDKSIKINDKSRYPEYSNEVVLINDRKLIIKEFRKPGVRMRQLKKVGPFIHKGCEQVGMYHLFDNNYEDEFLKKLSVLKIVDTGKI